MEKEEKPVKTEKLLFAGGEGGHRGQETGDGWKEI